MVECDDLSTLRPDCRTKRYASGSSIILLRYSITDDYNVSEIFALLLIRGPAANGACTLLNLVAADPKNEPRTKDCKAYHAIQLLFHRKGMCSSW